MQSEEVFQLPRTSRNAEKRRNTNKRESVVWLKFLNDMRTPPSTLVRILAVGKLKTPSDKRHKCTIEYGMKNSIYTQYRNCMTETFCGLRLRQSINSQAKQEQSGRRRYRFAVIFPTLTLPEVALPFRRITVAELRRKKLLAFEQCKSQCEQQ